MAVTQTQVTSTVVTADLLRAIVRALDGKKAGELQVLHVTAQSNITDYLVLATGTSEPHLRALRVELEKAIDTLHAPLAGMEVAPGSGWLVVDAYQVMVHLFLAEQRSQYRLDQLWKDAVAVPVADLLVSAAAPKKTKRKTPSVKTPALRKAVPKKAAIKKTVAKKIVTKKTAPAKKAAPSRRQAGKK